VCSPSQTSTYYGLSHDCLKLFIFANRLARIGQKFCRGQKFRLTPGPDFFQLGNRVARHLSRKKPNLVQKQAKRGKKSQILKNHEISAFSMCYHVFSKVVNKANGTVTITLTAIWNSGTFSASLLLLECLITLKAVCPVGGTFLLCF